MQEKLREYMDDLFQDAPKTRKVIELKEEILQNLTDKYNDLIAEGKTEEAAYNIAVASVGDVQELIDNLKNEPMPGKNYETSGVAEYYRKRSAILVSVAVALYILCVIPPMIFLNNPILGPVLMFVMIAIATGLLIYNNMTKPRKGENDGTVVAEFKEWKEKNSSKRQAYKAISAAIWSLAVAVYILVSFTTSAWHISWIIFLIAAAIDSAVKAVFDLKR